MRAMFLKGTPYVESDNAIPDAIAPATDHWRGNDSQKEALKKAFTHKVTQVWGPAATGKSDVIANIIVASLRRDPKEQILVNAPRNVPVDSLLKRVVGVYRGNPTTRSGDMHFVRLFSDSQVRAHYAVNDKELAGPCHIDKLRLTRAQQNPHVYRDFPQNHREMVQQGFIEDEGKAKAYLRCANVLTKAVMDNARVVFCTTAACRNKALCWATGRVVRPSSKYGKRR